MGNKNVPEIRFPEFSDAWEQNQLNAYLSTSKVKNSDERFGKEDVLSVSGEVGIVNQIEFHGRSFAGISVAPYGVVETGDLVYTKSPLKSNPFGIIKTNKGQVGLVSTLYAIYKPNDNVDSKFVERYFENDQRLNRYLKPLVNKGAKNDMKVSDDNALIGLVVFPVEVHEQRKISAFFSQLDNLITLHQEELSTLKQIKQGFLEKMFPKEGESVPEVRFPGFSGVWTEYKLGEMMESFEYGLNASATQYDGENKYIRITDIHDRSRKFLQDNLTTPNTDLSQAKAYLLQEGDILFARTGASVGKSYIYNKEDGIVYFAGFLIRARAKRDFIPKFIFQNTLTLQYDKFIKVTSQRSGQPGVNAQEYANYSFRVPNKKEQEQIGLFFKRFDDAIALQEKELEALQQTKKAFLQKMFV